MAFNLKEYFKISAIYTLVAAVPPATQLLVQPIIEGDGMLSAVDFGHLAIAESISALVFVLVGFSFSVAIVTFFYDYKGDAIGLRRMISTSFNAILTRGAIALGIGFLVSSFIGNFFSQPELQDFDSYGYAAIIIGISRTINITAASLYRNEKKVRKFVTVSLAYGLVRVAGQVAGLFLYDMSFLGYVYGSCVGGGLVSIFILINTYMKNGFQNDGALLRKMYFFGLPLVQYAFVNWGLLFADRYFLEATPVDLGIYDVALKFAAGVEMIITGIQNANQPEMFRMFSDGIEKNASGIKQLSNVFMLQAQVLIAAAIIPTMIYLDYFYETELRMAYGIIAIVFVRFITKAQYIIFALPLIYKKLTKPFLYINSVSLILNLVLNWLLIPKIGMYGAIVSTIASSVLLVILLDRYQGKVLNIVWNRNKIFYYPLLIIVVASVLELAKLQFDINPYVVGALIVATFGASFMVLYKNEIQGLGSKLINKSAEQ